MEAVSIKGTFLALSGLASILLGMFLLSNALKDKALKDVFSSENFVLLVAGLLFTFNGLGLFSAGAEVFSPYPNKYFWIFVSSSYFYPLTHPLILLFALYYPRAISSRIDSPRARFVLAFSLGVFALALCASALFFKSWFFYMDYNSISSIGYPALSRKQIPFLDLFYYIGIFSLLGTASYRYTRRETQAQEKNWLALILIGFIFGPVNRFWVLYFWSSNASYYNLSMWILEFALSACLALYLAYYSYQRLQENGNSTGEGSMGGGSIRRDKLMMYAMAGILIFMLFNPLMARLTDLDPYDIGFGLVRPICFGIAILQFRLFNINITKRVLLYTMITLSMGLAFFSIKNILQAFMPFPGFATIVLVTIIFLPLSSVTDYLAERLAPLVQNALKLERDIDQSGRLVEEKVSSLAEHLRGVFELRMFLTVAFLGIIVEILESGLSAIMDYPPLLAILFVGVLFSAIDYVVERSVLRSGMPQRGRKEPKAPAHVEVVSVKPA